jgi:hypothetical protein
MVEVVVMVMAMSPANNDNFRGVRDSANAKDGGQ